MDPSAAPSPLALDHLVIGARTLEEGVAFVADRLGAAPEPGGRHLGFGSHNALLRLGPDVYLEVLAPDPAQPPPARPRLFGLDEPETRARLSRGPALLHWVARAGALEAALDGLARAAGLPGGALGDPTPMRRGELAWRLALRSDGARPPDGLPSLIDWGGAPHPCGRLPDRGLALASLEPGLPGRAGEALAAWLTDPRVGILAAEVPAITARIAGPRGVAPLAG